MDTHLERLLLRVSCVLEEPDANGLAQSSNPRMWLGSGFVLRVVADAV